MPSIFDKILSQVEEPDRAVFQKYPKVAEIVNQQDEFTGRWEKWRREEWDEDRKMTKNAVEILQQKDAEIEALKLLQADDMNWDEMKGNIETLVEARIKQQKYATPEDFKGYVDKELNPRLTIKSGQREIPVAQYVQDLERGMEITYAQTAHLPQEYYQEFQGMNDVPKFTVKSLFDHMREKGLSNYDDAYNSLVSPLRAKKQEEARTVETEKIRKETRDEVLKEVRMSRDTMPTDDGSSNIQTPLQQRIATRSAKQEADKAPKLSPGTLGDGIAGRDAYTQYLKDQASGTKPAWPIQ